MTRMYRSASLFAWTPPTVIRHHDFFILLLFCFYGHKKRLTFGKLCLTCCCREEATSIPFLSCGWILTAAAHDLIEWTGWRLQTLALPLTSDNNISKYSSAPQSKIWSALCSVEQTKIYRHWNLRMSPQILWVQLKWEEKQNEVKPRSFLTPTHVDQCSANFNFNSLNSGEVALQ